MKPAPVDDDTRYWREKALAAEAKLAELQRPPLPSISRHEASVLRDIAACRNGYPLRWTPKTRAKLQEKGYVLEKDSRVHLTDQGRKYAIKRGWEVKSIRIS
jgi:hypothetical protein